MSLPVLGDPPLLDNEIQHHCTYGFLRSAPHSSIQHFAAVSNSWLFRWIFFQTRDLTDELVCVCQCIGVVLLRCANVQVLDESLS